MKVSKYIIGLSVMVAGLLSSCDQDNIGGIYTPTNQNISFEGEYDSEYVITPAPSTPFTIRVVRATTEGSYTAHYTISGNDDGYFTDQNNGTVTFADGQAAADVTISINTPEAGTEYSCTLTLSEADVATADKSLHAYSTKKINVICDYDWVEVPDGTYQSSFFSESWRQPMLKANGYNVYKLLSLYQEGYDITISIDSDNSVTVKRQVAWVDSTYGKISIVGDYNDDASGFAGYYYPEDNAALMYLYHFVPGVGGFGTFPAVLFFP